MTSFWLFVFGAAIGSFLNVVALRYNPDKFILNKSILGGRSACPKCGNKLNWFELVPLLSFFFLRGRCRNCKNKINWQYPLVELASGLIFVLIPHSAPFLASRPPLSILYILVLITLLLISLIDLRLKIIPNETNVLLALLGFLVILTTQTNFSLAEGSFFGAYAPMFGLRSNIWINHLVGGLVGLGFFGFIIAVTLGRGMGIGDLKLAGALGIIFGWPDIIFITVFAFIIGALFSLPSLLLKKQGMKSFLPFGPFLAIGSVVVFFWGEKILDFYFRLFKG